MAADPTPAHHQLSVFSPDTVTLADLRNLVVPNATAARARIRAHGDLGQASELARQLAALHAYVQDRDGRDLLAAEVRRTEILIGHLLGPATTGRPNRAVTGMSHGCDIPKDARVRFRDLAEHEAQVEALLDQGFVSRRVILDKLSAAAMTTTTGDTEPAGVDNPVVTTFRANHGCAAAVRPA